jgi:hypothetical protein
MKREGCLALLLGVRLLLIERPDSSLSNKLPGFSIFLKNSAARAEKG